MTNESVVAELRKLQTKWRTPVVSSVSVLEAVYKACAYELEPLIAQLQPGILNPQPGATEREAVLEEAAQLADPEKYTCEDSCAVGKVRDAILALRAPAEIPARPSIAQQSGKLSDSPVKRDSLNGPEIPAKLLTESQVRRSLDAASGGEWEGVNVQSLTKKLNGIIRLTGIRIHKESAPKEPPNVGSD